MFRRKSRLALSDSLNNYLTDCNARGQAPRTVEGKLGNIRKFTTWCAIDGILFAHQITLSTLEKYRQHLAAYQQPFSDRHLELATQRNRLTAVTVWLRHMHKSGFINDDLGHKFELPRAGRKPPTQPIPEGSAQVRRRVVTTREIQLERGGVPNAQLTSAGVREHCNLPPPLQLFREDAAQRVSLSPRACQRILKVSRTIADLDDSEKTADAHLAEAIAYRGIDHPQSQG